MLSRVTAKNVGDVFETQCTTPSKDKFSPNFSLFDSPVKIVRDGWFLLYYFIRIRNQLRYALGLPCKIAYEANQQLIVMLIQK